MKDIFSIIRVVVFILIFTSCTNDDDNPIAKPTKKLTSFEYIYNANNSGKITYSYNNSEEWIGGINAAEQDYSLQYENNKLVGFWYNDTPTYKTIYSRNSEGNIIEIIDGISQDKYIFSYVNNKLETIEIRDNVNNLIKNIAFIHSDNQLISVVSEAEFGIDGSRFDYYYDNNGQVTDVWQYYRFSNTEPWIIASKKNYTYTNRKNPLYELYKEHTAQENIIVTNLGFNDNRSKLFEINSSLKLFELEQHLIENVKVYDGASSPTLLSTSTYQYSFDNNGYPLQATKTNFDDQNNVTETTIYNYTYED